MSKLKKRYTVHFKGNGKFRAISFRAVDDSAAVIEAKRLREENMDMHLIRLLRGSWTETYTQRVFSSARQIRRFMSTRSLYPGPIWDNSNFERGALDNDQVLKLLSESMT